MKRILTGMFIVSLAAGPAAWAEDEKAAPAPPPAPAPAEDGKKSAEDWELFVPAGDKAAAPKTNSADEESVAVDIPAAPKQ